MSVASPSKFGQQARPLRNEERALLRRLVSGESQELESKVSDSVVYDMADGGMGSIRFLDGATGGRQVGRVVAEAEYIDQDGVPVNITLNLDQKGNLFEVDFCKTDFSPLVRYPRPVQLVLRRIDSREPTSIEAALASNRY